MHVRSTYVTVSSLASLALLASPSQSTPWPIVLLLLLRIHLAALLLMSITSSRLGPSMPNMESPSDGSEGFQPRPANIASSCEALSERAQTHRQPGLMRIPLHEVGYFHHNRVGVRSGPGVSWIAQPPLHTMMETIASRVPSACGLTILGAMILHHLWYWTCPECEQCGKHVDECGWQHATGTSWIGFLQLSKAL